jgi:predicted RNA binding protein YcfA (HicA-like mRNA interferase family)
MPGLPVLSGREFVRVMEKLGYVLDHMRGSHMILVHPSRSRLSVPDHRELGRGLLRALIRDAGLSRDEFLELMDR